MHWFWWIVILYLLVAVPIFAWSGYFYFWRRRVTSQAIARTETIETELGKVEFVEVGEGPTVLFLHPGSSGHDIWRNLTGFVEAGYSVLTPDRPGYWGTALGSDNSPQAQGALMAEFLDALEVKRVALMSGGAGAPIAIHFAANFPERCAALVLISPALESVEFATPETLAKLDKMAAKPRQLDMNAFLINKSYAWRPKRYVRVTAKRVSTLDDAQVEVIVDKIMADPKQRKQMRQLLELSAPALPRWPGARNDLINTQELAPLPFSQVTAPTLLAASRVDRVVPYASVVRASEQIANAELMSVDQMGNMIAFGDPEVTQAIDERILDFLKEHFPPDAQATADSPETPPRRQQR